MVELSSDTSHLPYLSPWRDQKPLPPPLPIGAFKINDDIPNSIHKKPIKVPPVETAINKVKPSVAPKRVERTVTYNGEQNVYEGLLFTRKRKPSWFFTFPEEKIVPLSEPFQMNGARQAMKFRQDQSRPIPPTKEKIDQYLIDHPESDIHLGLCAVEHDAQVIFTMSAWSWLRNELLDNEVPSEEAVESFCCREVYLNNYGVIYDRDNTDYQGKLRRTCGQLDVYGNLADNQGVLIDYGSFSVDKQLQMLGQYYGTKELISEYNHNQCPPITTLIGEYYKDEDGTNIVHLLRPDQDYQVQY